MKEKVKDLWVEALRSGKYKQGKHSLKNNNDKYCCLGVLCDVYAKTQKKKGFSKNQVDIIGAYTFGDTEKEAVLPENVKKWAQIGNKKIRISISNDQRIERFVQSHLIHMNDEENKTFDEIATFIEKNWREF